MKATTAIVGGRVVLDGRVAPDLCVIVDDGMISAIVPAAAVPDGAIVVDAEGRLVTPGLIDVHAHGAVGHSFNDATDDSIAAVTGHLAANGVTSVLATLSTDSLDAMDVALAALAAWMAVPDRPGTRITGVHLEGPWLSPAQRGAHPLEFLRLPGDGSADRLLRHAEVITLVTLAPELDGGVELVRRLVAAGITVAAGHSDATEDELAPALAAGISHLTHLWSGQSSTVRVGPWRKPGLLEVGLASDDLTAEVIADDRHLPPTLLRLARRCLAGRLSAVSDSTCGAGLPEGSRYRVSSVDIEVKDGVAMVVGQPMFAGSTTDLNRMVPVLMKRMDIDVAEAVTMAAGVPARVAGLDDCGRLAPGTRADVVLFDDDFTAHAVMVGGKWQADQ